jgi:hypothetical protein
MNTPLKLAGFGLGLVAAFGAAVGVGSAVGPVGPAVQSSADDHATTTAPSAGTYRLFPDFEHGSVVRTAAFTVAATTTHEEGGS